MSLRHSALLLCFFGLVAGASKIDDEIVVTTSGSSPPTAASPANFTGAAQVHTRFQATEPGRVRGGIVSFEPGARTNWHKHPLGQTLIITEGIGWVQQRNGPKREVRPGDTVWIPPNTEHWHGAAADSAMSHVAIGEMSNGKTVEWLEPVTQEQYSQ